jgi:hypothetical protein
LSKLRCGGIVDFRIERPREEAGMERHYYIVKSTRNGQERYVFRSSLGWPRLEEREELVLSINSKEYNPPTKARAKIFRRLRKQARERNIPHVINLDV